MQFAALWMGLEIIILSAVKSHREGKIPYDITYMWNLKKKKDTRISLMVQKLKLCTSTTGGADSMPG